jgi:hypothetical protein
MGIMSFLTTDYTEVKEGGNGGDFQPLPIGDYEVLVSKVEMKKTQNKVDMISLELTVRDDVAQEGKKRKFFDNLPIMPQLMWKIQTISKHAGFPVGQEFATPADFAKALQYKCFSIRNKHEEYNGKTSDRVAYYNASKHPLASGGSSSDPFANNDPFAQTGKTIDIQESDLPF